MIFSNNYDDDDGGAGASTKACAHCAAELVAVCVMSEMKNVFVTLCLLLLQLR